MSQPAQPHKGLSRSGDLWLKTNIPDLGAREDAAAIMRAIIGLGRSLGIPVPAEGVETPEQLAHLYAVGCAQARGYLFSRPIAAADITAMILRGSKLDQG